MHPHLFGAGDSCGHYVHWSAWDEEHREADDTPLRQRAAQVRAEAEARAAAEVVAEAEAILRRATKEGS